MTTISMVRVFDERDNTLKMLTHTRKIPTNDSKPQSNIHSTNEPGITITHADDHILPRINTRGNIILELTKEQFFDIRNRLQY